MVVKAGEAPAKKTEPDPPACEEREGKKGTAAAAVGLEEGGGGGGLAGLLGGYGSDSE